MEIINPKLRLQHDNVFPPPLTLTRRSPAFQMAAEAQSAAPVAPAAPTGVKIDPDTFKLRLGKLRTHWLVSPVNTTPAPDPALGSPDKEYSYSRRLNASPPTGVELLTLLCHFFRRAERNGVSPIVSSSVLVRTTRRSPSPRLSLLNFTSLGKPPPSHRFSIRDCAIHCRFALLHFRWVGTGGFFLQFSWFLNPFRLFL